MTKLSDTQLKDLIELATERARESLHSVDQLVDDPEQVNMLWSGVLVCLAMDTAEFMAHHIKLPSGELPIEVAYFKVLTTLAKCGDHTALREFLDMSEQHLTRKRRH
jgi:hypothetical protein